MSTRIKSLIALATMAIGVSAVAPIVHETTTTSPIKNKVLLVNNTNKDNAKATNFESIQNYDGGEYVIKNGIPYLTSNTLKPYNVSTNNNAFHFPDGYGTCMETGDAFDGNGVSPTGLGLYGFQNLSTGYLLNVYVDKVESNGYARLKTGVFRIPGLINLSLSGFPKPGVNNLLAGDINSNIVYANPQGLITTNSKWINENGKVYYFKAPVIFNYWWANYVEVPGTVSSFAPAATAVLGLQNIDGKMYYFNPDTGVLENSNPTTLSIKAWNDSNVLHIAFNNGKINATGDTNWVGHLKSSKPLSISLYNSSNQLLKNFTFTGRESGAEVAAALNGTNYTPGDILSINYNPDQDTHGSLNYGNADSTTTVNNVSKFTINNNGLTKINIPYKLNLKAWNDSNVLNIAFNNGTLSATGDNNWIGHWNYNKPLSINLYNSDNSLIKNFTFTGQESGAEVAAALNGTKYSIGDSISIKYTPDADTNGSLNYTNTNDQTNKVNNTSSFKITSTGLLENGLVSSNGNVYYQQNGKYLTNTWINVDSKGQRTYDMVNGTTINAYYLGANGAAESGLQNIQGVLQYFNPTTKKMALNEFVNIDGKMYYAKPVNGQLATGNYTVNDANLTFNSDGTLKDGLIDYNGIIYYYQNGKVITSLKLPK